ERGLIWNCERVMKYERLMQCIVFARGNDHIKLYPRHFTPNYRKFLNTCKIHNLMEIFENLCFLIIPVSKPRWFHRHNKCCGPSDMAILLNISSQNQSET
ncbi:hypothetical protein L9F63_017605, partial [Diploptera punctata]